MAFASDNLKEVFRMMSPVDLSGLPKNSLGKVSRDLSFVERALSTLFDRNGGGAVSAVAIVSALDELLSGASAEEVKQFHKYVRVYSTVQAAFDKGGITWHKKHRDAKTKELRDVQKLEEIVSATKSGLNDKDVLILLSNSHFVNPAVRSAESAQLFLNFVPTVIMSRCVPYFETEFVFDRPSQSKLAAPSLMKFLLGAQDTDKFKVGSADDLMTKANVVSRRAGSSGDNSDVSKSDRQHTVAGMEMFTSPQTLVNADSIPLGNRYIPVLDPFRPFMSLESATINVTPTVGLYSYKKANLVMKLHDRSRLAEIADLIQPIVYTKTTVWLTYGWRHPVEPGNPYADFINSTMLVRESYGISNSSYEFDQSGQVTINLELYTKGVRELRDIRVTGLSQTFEDIERRLRNVAELITELRHKLKLDPPTGLNREIRAFQVLEAAEDASFPDLDVTEVTAAIKQLENSFLKKDAVVDSEAASKLKKLIKDYYAVDAKTKKFVYKESLEHTTDNVVSKIFDEIFTGPDPFAVYDDKINLKKNELGTGDNPFTQVYETYNKVKTVTGPTKPTLVSVGKIVSSLLARSVAAFDGVDELQLFFYTFNDRAGRASNQNIAEFPINTAVFRDQVRDFVAKKRTSRIPVEELLQLLIESQLQDPRGPGYGLYAHFEPYDPKNKEPQLKKSSEKSYESALASINDKRGSFRMPMIEVYVESTYRAPKNQPFDLLKHFESSLQADTGRPSTGKYARVLRIHFFDKQVDPYPIATSLLRTDDGTGSALVNREALDELLKDKEKRSVLARGIANLPEDIRNQLQLSEDSIVISNEKGNDKIKKFVSQLVPTLIYGGNASSITNMTIATKQDPNLTAVQMLGNKAGRPSVTQPNGGGTGGLPLRIIPAAVTATTLGCPLLQFAQRFFIDVGTGTTIDSLYLVTGLTHTISPGRFETQLNLTWGDSYGSYESATSLLKTIEQIKDVT